MQHQTHLQDALTLILHEWSGTKIFFCVFAILLMVLNWLIESLKWRFLLKDLQPVSYLKAFQSVCAGLSISILTPNRIGEYAGRVLFLQHQNKLPAVSLNIVGSFALIIVSSAFGAIGSLVYGIVVSFNWAVLTALFTATVACILMYVLYFHLNFILDRLTRFAALQKLNAYVEVVRAVTKERLLKIIFYSALRYMVYSVQFVILLWIFRVDVSFLQAIITIMLIFWAMAVLPSITIAELGIRASTSLFFLQHFSTNTVGIVSASITLWLMNLILPAIIGSVFILSIKIYQTGNR